jgi:hypothetical protein
MNAGLSDVIAAMDDLGGRWTVLLTTPTTSWFAVYDGGWSGSPESLAGRCDVALPARGFPDDSGWSDLVFEVRAGSGDREVRWVKGHAVSVCEVGDDADRSFRLVLGEGTGDTADGWSLMQSSRVGTYAVPADIGAGSRAALLVSERTAIDHHGNVAVADEILLGLVPWTAATQVRS